MVLGSGIRNPGSGKNLFRIPVLGSGIRNPGSGKNLFRIPDLGVKKAPDPGSRIRNTVYNPWWNSNKTFNADEPLCYTKTTGT
jgi:hypothetical protein